MTVGLLTAGCNQNPERVVKKYLDYTFLDNNGEDAYELLSADDKAYINKEQFCKSVRRNNVLNKKIMDKYEDYFFYEIVEKSQAGDTIIVTAELNRPNAFYILSDLVGYAMITAFGSLPESDRTHAIGKKFDAIMMSKNRLITTEEKVFRIIREGGRYKIFLNAGREEKEKKFRSVAMQLVSEAEELERTNNYERALQLYSSAVALWNQETLREKKAKLEKIRSNLLLVGQMKVFGNVLFRPEKIEMKPVATVVNDSAAIVKAGLKPALEVMILSFSLKNVSEGQVFRPVQPFAGCINTISDNFGNMMEGYNNMVLEEHNLHLKPGETRFYRVFCETPLTEAAKNFVWKVKIITNNSGRQDEVYVRFSKDEWKQLVAVR
jgi:hypothetical protein